MWNYFAISCAIHVELLCDSHSMSRSSPLMVIFDAAVGLPGVLLNVFYITFKPKILLFIWILSKNVLIAGNTLYIYPIACLNLHPL